MNVLLFYVLKLNNEMTSIKTMGSKAENQEQAADKGQDGEKIKYINEEYGYSFEYYDIFLNTMESQDGSILMLENEDKTIRIDTYVETGIDTDGIFGGYINNTPNIIMQENDEGLGLYYEVDGVQYYKRLLVEGDTLAIVELRFTEDKKDVQDLMELIKNSFKLELVDGYEFASAFYDREVTFNAIEEDLPASVDIRFDGSYAVGSVNYAHDENHLPAALFEGRFEDNQMSFRFENDGFDNSGTCHISFIDDGILQVDIVLDNEEQEYYSVKPASGKYEHSIDW